MFLRFGWVGGSVVREKAKNCSLLPNSAALVPLPSPGTVRHPILDWDGGGTSQDDNGRLDPLPRGLALRDVDLGELDGVDVRGPDLIGVLGRKSFPV